eukprot:jgi/Botrbrau1/16974/Bobra.49_2s0035.1
MQARRKLDYLEFGTFSASFQETCSFILKHTVSMPVLTTVAYTCAARKFRSLKTLQNNEEAYELLCGEGWRSYTGQPTP